MKGPCPKNCPRRRGATKENPVSCHSSCAAYKAYWEENRRMNEENVRRQAVDGFSILSRKRLRRIKAAAQEQREQK